MSKNTITQGRRSLSSSLATLLMLGLFGAGHGAMRFGSGEMPTEAPSTNPRRRRWNGPAFQGEQEKARRVRQMARHGASEG